MNNPQGSIWRKWDLHLHTPSSHEYGDRSVSNKQIIDELLKAEIAAVAITDHCLMDVDRIKELQALAGNRLTVFPGIELRSELGGRSSVHFIGIFPEDCNVEDLWTKLSGKLDLTQTDITARGIEKIYRDFRETAKIIHTLDGLVSVHAGRKSNSIERIPNAQKFKQAVKEDLAGTSIDIMEIGDTEDVDAYRQVVFPDIEDEFPLILCSDNHNINSYVFGESCWIKADPTFAGLRQVCIECSDRVFLGQIPPLLERVRQNRTKHIHSLRIERITDSDLDEIWFDNHVTFNSGFVAIIGNRGSGKSALTDTLGLLGNSPQSDSFSFLHRTKFKQKKGNKAKHFNADLTWESGNIEKRNLDDDVEDGSVETIKYIPQNYLEIICNELSESGEGRFDRELKSIIFSHASASDTLGKETLDALIEYKSEETYQAIGLLQDDLHLINQDILSLEDQLTDKHRKFLENQIKEKEDLLKAHVEAKPGEISKPADDSDLQSRIATITTEIEKGKSDVKSLEENISSLSRDHQKTAKNITSADKLIKKIENFQKQLETLESDCVEDLEELGIRFEDVITINIDLKAISKAKNNAQQRAPELAEAIETAEKEKHEKEKHLEQLAQKLDEPNQRYQAYLSATEEWETKRKAIIGDVDLPDSLEYFKNQLENIKSVPEKLQKANNRREEKTREIYRKIQALASVYKTAYHPVRDFIDKHPIARSFGLDFQVSVINMGFEKSFFEDYISHGRRGSFCGDAEGKMRLSKILDETDFDSEEGVISFVGNIMLHLCQDLRPGEKCDLSISSQLRKNIALQSFYDFLFSLNYLKPKYVLQLSGKDVGQLSPGERGTLLLVFYLLIDKSDKPLVIDQPEGNLDNQTVFNTLVPCIKEAKNRRQIIIVTHNPNLAVACDADQVIKASIDKQNRNAVAYVSGAIENPEMNIDAVNILEGTRPAFESRRAKYRIPDHS
jgi:ABC-type lipoprotein export system ATPase subunit